MKNPLRPTLVLLFWLVSSSYLLGQNRCVVYTLDESGSMSDQYYMINQNLQLLVGLLDVEDELYIIRGSQRPIKVDLKTKNSFNRRIRAYRRNEQEQGGAFHYALEVLKNSSKSEKFLIFAGDGYLTDFPEVSRQALIENNERKYARTIILGINNNGKFKDSKYYEFVKSFDNTDEVLVNEKEELEEKMEEVSISIIGSDKGISTTRDKNQFFVQNEIPVNKLILLVQNLNQTFEPKVLKASISSQKLKVEGPYQAQSGYLNGAVYHLSFENNQSIPEGKVIINFSDEVNSKVKVKVLPILMVEVTGSPVGLELNRQKENQYFVCQDVKEVPISAQLNIFNKAAPLKIQNKAEVFIEFEGKKSQMKFNGKSFTTVMPYTGKDPVSVNIVAELDGYFNKKSKVFIVQRDDCFFPNKLEVSTKVITTKTDDNQASTVTADSSGKVTFTLPEDNGSDEFNIRLEVKNINLVSEDGVKRAVSLDSVDLGNDFELEVLESELPVEDIRVIDGKFEIRFKSNAWCNCLVNSESQKIKYRILSKTKNIEPFEGEIPVSYRVQPWWVRCQTLFLWIFAILASVLYLYGIIRKPRFGKVQIQRITSQGGRPPRKQRYVLRTNFINRYLVPYIAEKNTVDGIRLSATRSKNTIEVQKKSLRGKDFNIGTVNKDNLKRMKVVKLSRTNPLEIQGRMNKKTYELVKA